MFIKNDLNITWHRNNGVLLLLFVSFSLLFNKIKTSTIHKYDRGKKKYEFIKSILFYIISINTISTLGNTI